MRAAGQLTHVVAASILLGFLALAVTMFAAPFSRVSLTPAAVVARHSDNSTERALPRKDAHQRRLDVSAVFVSILVGLAYAEMFVRLRESLHDRGFVLEDALLSVTFFLTGLRFFIGNLVHLTTLDAPGIVWIYDLFWISAQGIVLALLGSVTSVAAGRQAQIGFHSLLMTLLVVDIAWIGSRALLRATMKSWSHLPSPAWQWAVLNTMLIVVVFAIDRSAKRLLGRSALGLLAFANAVAFVVDVFMIDAAGII